MPATAPASAHYEFRGGDSWRDPWSAYRALRDLDPVHRVEHGDGRFWVLSRFDDVFDAARDTTTFSSAQGLVPDADSMAMFDGVAAPIVMMDPPDHTAMRRLVSKPMTPRRVADLEPAIHRAPRGRQGHAPLRLGQPRRAGVRPDRRRVRRPPAHRTDRRARVRRPSLSRRRGSPTPGRRRPRTAAPPVPGLHRRPGHRGAVGPYVRRYQTLPFTTG